MATRNLVNEAPGPPLAVVSTAKRKDVVGRREGQASRPVVARRDHFGPAPVRPNSNDTPALHPYNRASFPSPDESPYRQWLRYRKPSMPRERTGRAIIGARSRA